MKSPKHKIFHSFSNDLDKQLFVLPKITQDSINKLIHHYKVSDSPQRSSDNAIKKSTSRIIDEFMIKESSPRRDLILNEST